MRRIAVLGGGNGAFITAAHLASMGFSVSLMEAPGFEAGIEKAKEQGGIHLEVRGGLDMKEGFWKLHSVGTDPEEALDGVNLALVIVPAFAQKRFAQLVAPHVKEGMQFVIAPGNFGGAIEFGKVLKEAGAPRAIPAEMECMIYSGFKEDSGSVWVSGYKKNLRVAAFPGRETKAVVDAVQEFYPDVKPAASVLETGLRNVNTVFHAPIVVTNAGWIEETKGDFLFYWQGCSSSVGNVVEGVEEERLAVGNALGLNLTPNYDVMIDWYGHQGAKGDSLKEVMKTNPAYEWDTAPKSLNHRFIIEDIPYGMVPLEDLANLVGVKVPLTTAVIELSQRMLGKDMRKDARTLTSLGLGKMSLSELNHFVLESGWWQ